MMAQLFVIPVMNFTGISVIPVNPDKFNFDIIGTGIDHYGGIATKISPLSAILLKLGAKMQFGGQKSQNFAKTAPPTNFILVSLEPA